MAHNGGLNKYSERLWLVGRPIRAVRPAAVRMRRRGARLLMRWCKVEARRAPLLGVGKQRSARIVTVNPRHRAPVLVPAGFIGKDSNIAERAHLGVRTQKWRLRMPPDVHQMAPKYWPHRSSYLSLMSDDEQMPKPDPRRNMDSCSTMNRSTKMAARMAFRSIQDRILARPPVSCGLNSLDCVKEDSGQHSFVCWYIRADHKHQLMRRMAAAHSHRSWQPRSAATCDTQRQGVSTAGASIQPETDARQGNLTD